MLLLRESQFQEEPAGTRVDPPRDCKTPRERCRHVPEEPHASHGERREHHHCRGPGISSMRLLCTSISNFARPNPSTLGSTTFFPGSKCQQAHPAGTAGSNFFRQSRKSGSPDAQPLWASVLGKCLSQHRPASHSRATNGPGVQILQLGETLPCQFWITAPYFLHGKVF